MLWIFKTYRCSICQFCRRLSKLFVFYFNSHSDPFYHLVSPMQNPLKYFIHVKLWIIMDENKNSKGFKEISQVCTGVGETLYQITSNLNQSLCHIFFEKDKWKLCCTYCIALNLSRVNNEVAGVGLSLKNWKCDGFDTFSDKGFKVDWWPAETLKKCHP